MIEDSTFEGWTRGPVLGYPTGSRVEGPALQHGFQGTVWSLPQADEESIKYAKRSWPERDADDFEAVGRTWTDRRDGTAYRLVRGNPIAGLGLDGRHVRGRLLLRGRRRAVVPQAERRAGHQDRRGGHVLRALVEVVSGPRPYRDPKSGKDEPPFKDWRDRVDTMGPGWESLPKEWWGSDDWKRAQATNRPMNLELPPAPADRVLPPGFTLYGKPPVKLTTGERALREIRSSKVTPCSGSSAWVVDASFKRQRALQPRMRDSESHSRFATDRPPCIYGASNSNALDANEEACT